MMCIVFLLLATALDASPIKVALRYDDPRLQSNAFNDSLFTMLQRNQIPFTVAVIPCTTDERFVCDTAWQFFSTLKQALADRSIEVALHGFKHVLWNTDSHHYGEFNGVDYQEQYRRIAKGKQLLDSVLDYDIVTFVPPWNAYDDNTLKVLENCHFKAISAAVDQSDCLSSNRINYYPCTVAKPTKLLAAIENNRHRKGLIVLNFHRYNFDDQFTLADFERLLLDLRANYPLEFVTFAGLMAQNDLSDKARLTANRMDNFLSKKMQLGKMLYPTTYCRLIRVLNGVLCCFFPVLILFLFLFMMRRKQAKKSYLQERGCLY